jgi:outer membrane usher protein FimD/PapC
VRKSLPVGPGYGYGFQAVTNGDLDSVVQYQTSFGRYDANYRRSDGRQESSLSGAGGLAFIDGNVSFTRPVQNGFALIRIPDCREFAVTSIISKSEPRIRRDACLCPICFPIMATA